MKFNYIASQQDGGVTEGEYEAKDVAEVLDFLASKGLKPVSVRQLDKPSLASFTKIFQGKINLTDQVFISKYLALMLKLGTSLLQAINILIEDFDKPAVKAFLLEIRSNLEKGLPFHLTFSRYPRIFSQVYINLIRAGEASGNLEKIFEELSESLAKQKALTDQIRSALIYPVILLVGSSLILIFLVTFALPKIARVFIESGFQPPLFSKIVFGVGLFISDNLFYILGVLVVLAIVFVRFYLSSLIFKKFLFDIITRVPIIREVLRKTALQRFAATLSALIRAGMPITEALEITADAVGNFELRESLIRVSKEGLARGLTLGEAFRRERFFPRTVVNLMAISERTGRIDEVLVTLSDFYIKEIDSSIKALVSFLEPVLLLFIGAIIGIIALSIIVPIYQLTTQF